MFPIAYLTILKPDLVPESLLGQDVEIPKLKQIYREMIDTFERARMVDPRDPDLLVTFFLAFLTS